jgi:hypothetical protein
LDEPRGVLVPVPAVWANLHRSRLRHVPFFWKYRHTRAAFSTCGWSE